MTQEKSDIEKLQLLEQNLQQYLQQRQQYQMHLKEVESALSELDNSKETYKIIGNIMVDTDKTQLKQELESKKNTYELRIKSIENQEKKIKEKAQELQQSALEKEGQNDTGN
ncbi:MAG: prefoldin subunit beta [Nanobdellota archaeon]